MTVHSCMQAGSARGERLWCRLRSMALVGTATPWVGWPLSSLTVSCTIQSYGKHIQRTSTLPTRDVTLRLCCPSLTC